MPGTANGTSSTPEGCAPYWPVSANGGGYLCVTSLIAGVRTTPDNNGVKACFTAGLSYRNSGDSSFGSCVDSATLVPGDFAASSTQYSDGAAAGATLCGQRGLESKASSIAGVQVYQCTGSAAASNVSDAKAQGKLDALHTDLLGVTTAISKTGTATATAHTPDVFDVQPILTAFLVPVLLALSFALLWAFWKQIAR